VCAVYRIEVIHTTQDYKTEINCSFFLWETANDVEGCKRDVTFSFFFGPCSTTQDYNTFFHISLFFFLYDLDLVYCMGRWLRFCPFSFISFCYGLDLRLTLHRARSNSLGRREWPKKTGPLRIGQVRHLSNMCSSVEDTSPSEHICYPR
jgi:hypothetical protein